MMMTANPRAKIESKTFHLIVIDECQEADDFIVAKSIGPMLASTNGTMVKTGTPTTHKNNFYRAIQMNKRRQTGRGSKQNHFQWDWRDVSKVSVEYGKFIKKESLRIGEDSDEFQMSYNCKWLLERGMFVTSGVMDELGDTSQEVVKAWHRTACVVGIDPARKMDSTVVTVLWVDWDRPDEFGYFDHRILNWLEIQGDDWEDQYFQIVNFLENYNVLAVGVDANGVGDAVAQRLRLLLPRSEVYSVGSSQPEQSKRWKHLKQLLDRRMVGWPAHAKTRRLRTWKRFYQQMTDLETKFTGPNFLAHAPDEAHAHDDYADSLAIAVSLTIDLTMPQVEVSSSPFFR
jgi:Terminase RNaseH-like domain